MELEPGMHAPDFEREDAEGKSWRLSDLKGQKVIIYFYPTDDTPGCTAQACDFRDSSNELSAAGYAIFGVSPQGADSHTRFAEKFNLNFPLLIDEDHSMADSYGAWGEKKNYGRTYEGIKRSTFVIDEDGLVLVAQYNVKARGHVERLKKALL